MRKLLDVRERNLELFADLAGEELIDFAMARNCRGLASGTIDVNRVPTTFAEQLTALLL